MSDLPRNTNSTAVLGLVTGGIAHDLNNLLSPILLGVQTLQRNDPDDKTKRILSMIEQSSRRAADLIRHLLDFARRERTHGVQVTTAAADLPEVFEECVSDLQSHSRDIEVHYDPQLVQSHLAMERNLLRLVLGAVLQNAWDWSASSPRVAVHCQRMAMNESERLQHRMAKLGDYACISVQDNGQGMSEDVTKHACEPFYTTHRDGSHVGLGLFVVYTLLKQHDGFVEFESAGQQGTLVRLYIPVQSAT